MSKAERCLIANKRIYTSHDEAESACGRNRYLSPYICRICLHWHIGHTYKSRRDERRAGLAGMVREAETLGLYDTPEFSLAEKPGGES